MKITVAVRNVYGYDLVYPADDSAALFAALLQVNTFNGHQLRIIRALGYTINVAAGTLPAGM
jgi:hypothetical protein